MKALIIFSLFIICYIHSQEANEKTLIYGFDNIKIKDNQITFDFYTNSMPKKEILSLNKGETEFNCNCKSVLLNLNFYNNSCSNNNINIKSDERLSFEIEKNSDYYLNSYSSAQGKNLKRAEENKIPFDKLLDMYKLEGCKKVTNENSKILINCTYLDEFNIVNDKNDSAIFYIGDDFTKIAIPSKMTDIGNNKIQIELSPPISFYNVPFHNTIGVSKDKDRSYLMQLDKTDEKFNFTYFSKNAPKKKGTKLSAGAILAIIIPSVLAIAAVIAIIILLAGKSGAPVATTAPNPQTYNTLGLNSSSSVNKN